MFYGVVYFLHLAVALHGGRCVDCVSMQTVTGHLMAHHACDHHARVDPCQKSRRSAQSLTGTPTQAQRRTHTHTLPTHTNLNVIAVGWVFQVIYGAHHVQRHVTDIMSVILCLLWSTCHHHVGVSNGLNLENDRDSSSDAAGLTDNRGRCVGKNSHTNLENAMFLTERVKKSVHGVEHGDNLHGSDVAANACETHHIAEQNGHIREHLGDDGREITSRERNFIRSEDGGTCSRPIFQSALHNQGITATQTGLLHSRTWNFPFYGGPFYSINHLGIKLRGDTHTTIFDL